MILLVIVQLTLPGVSNKGDRIFYHDARSCALGGVMLVLENSPNPSTMGLLDNASVSVSGALFVVNEKRGLRVYDSYGNNMGISTVTDITSTHPAPSVCTFVFPFQLLRTGLQFEPVWDYTYSYYREYRDAFYQVTKIVDQEYTGRTYAVSPMVGVVYSWVNLGVMQRFMYGRREFRETIVYEDAPDSTTTAGYDLNGMNTQFGFLLSPDIHIRISYLYQFPYALETEAAASTDSFPAQHNVGFMYQPPGRIPTKFFGEINYELWENPIVVYKIGVEHTLHTCYAIRYGFCLFPDYTETAIWTTVLTIGFGIEQPRFTADIGYAYGKRDYTSANYPGLDSAENFSFDESLNNILLSFTIRL